MLHCLDMRTKKLCPPRSSLIAFFTRGTEPSGLLSGGGDVCIFPQVTIIASAHFSQISLASLWVAIVGATAGSQRRRDANKNRWTKPWKTILMVSIRLVAEFETTHTVSRFFLGVEDITPLRVRNGTIPSVARTKSLEIFLHHKFNYLGLWGTKVCYILCTYFTDSARKISCCFDHQKWNRSTNELLQTCIKFEAHRKCYTGFSCEGGET